MLLYSLIVVWFAQTGHVAWRPPRWPWFPSKRRPSFADMLAALRRESVRASDWQRLPDPRLRENLLDDVLAAAGLVA